LRSAPAQDIVFVTCRIAGRTSRPEPQSLNPRVASLLVDALHRGEQLRKYDLHAWVVMSNHMYLVLRPNQEVPAIVRWLKSRTAARANQVLGRTGAPFWRRDYFGHRVRSDEELGSIIECVEAQPVTSGLVASPEEWPSSSAAALREPWK
jgi:putative transposase